MAKRSTVSKHKWPKEVLFHNTNGQKKYCFTTQWPKEVLFHNTNGQKKYCFTTQMAKRKNTYNDLQNIHIKLKSNTNPTKNRG
jgi:hypothetical protein